MNSPTPKPMIVAGIDLRSMQRLTSGNIQAVFEFLHLRSHGSKVPRHQRNSVRFFYSQFTRITNANSFARIRRNRR